MVAALPVLLDIQFLLNALLLDIAQTPPGLGIRSAIGGTGDSDRRLSDSMANRH